MKMQTTWNLKLLYKSENDPQIEKDVKMVEKLCTSFEKKYRGKPFTKTPQSLLKALKESEKMDKFTESRSPLYYLNFRTDLNADDSRSFALSTKYGNRLTEAGNKTTFFGLDIAKIPANKHKSFLNYPPLKKYRYMLEKVFEHAKYNLPEGEEQLASLLSDPGYGMWVETQEKLLSKQIIKHKGKELTLSKASNELSYMPKKDRREVQDKINAVLKSVSHVAEGELNAIYNFKKIMDKRRGYEKSYSATVLGYENDEGAIENLVALVTKHFKISHKFYKLHAKLLGEKRIGVADRMAKIGEIKVKFDFKRSVDILRNTLAKVDKEYVTILDGFLEKGQIDVYPKKGKRSGAYCAHSGLMPTFVLLNHVDTMGSLLTLAHEMGHAFHSELSKSQPSMYRGYPMSTAEVASTFFEQLVAEEVEKSLSKEELVISLHNRILNDIATIFRQIAFFNFEKELHEMVRRDGQVSKEDIAKLMSKHFKSYFGDAVEVGDDDGYFYVSLGHMRRFFYVYSYAYGQIISRALYEKWKKDPTYAKKVKHFLSAGSSMSPENIFKSIGVDTSKTSFFKAGLKSIERDIDKLEKLSRK